MASPDEATPDTPAASDASDAPPAPTIDIPREAPPEPAAARAVTRPWHDPLWRLRWLAPGLALVVALVVLIRCHWYFFYPWAMPVSNDEGYISAMALRMIHGHWLPYVDAISQRGPILYWLASLTMKIGGQFSWLPIRWLALGTGVSVVSLTFVVGAEYLTPFAAGVASLFVTYFLAYELLPWDGIGYNGEIVAVGFVLLSLLCVARIMRGSLDDARRPRLLVAAGVFAALAGLSKQMTLIHTVPTALWIALGRDDDPRPLSRRLGDVVRFGVGAVVPFVLVVGIYAVTGHLREFVYYFQRYGRDIFMAPVTKDYYRERLREQIDHYSMGMAALTALGVTALAQATRQLFADTGSWLGRARRNASGFFLVAQLVAATLGACFTGRFFPHYFVQVFPLAAVVAASVASSLPFEPSRPRDRAPVIGGVTMVLGAALILAIAASALGRHVRTRRETDRWYQDPRADPIVRYVLERSRPEETIFVWGFRAETYVSSARLPASRYVYTVYPSGVVPWFQSTRDEEERRVVPGSRRQLLDDLEVSKPILVVDAGRSMNGRYMYNYPELRRYLDRNYCFMRYVDGEPVYRRRQNGDCPPADY